MVRESNQIFGKIHSLSALDPLGPSRLGVLRTTGPEAPDPIH
jgi:hypothetical protein